MPTPGAIVVRAGGARGVLAGGGAALFNAAGLCDACCSPVYPCCEVGGTDVSPSWTGSGPNTITLAVSVSGGRTSSGSFFYDFSGSGDVVLTSNDGSGGTFCTHFYGNLPVSWVTDTDSGTSTVQIVLILLRNLLTGCASAPGVYTRLSLVHNAPVGVGNGYGFRAYSRPGATWWYGSLAGVASGNVCPTPFNSGNFSPDNTSGSSGSTSYTASGSVTPSPGGGATGASHSSLRTGTFDYGWTLSVSPVTTLVACPDSAADLEGEEESPFPGFEPEEEGDGGMMLALPTPEQVARFSRRQP